MSKSILNILYPFDNNYAPYAGISITSLLENNKDVEEINIYIMGFSIDKNNVERLKDTAKTYRRSIFFLNQEEVETKIRELNMPSYRGASVAAARLFISYFISEDLGRVLYLDSDTIITGSLKYLFECDLKGAPVGMVLDGVARDYKTIVGFRKDEAYYNAGVILYDLKKWNELECTERIIDHIKNVRNNYEALDQDLMNIVLKGQITTLGIEYNYQPFHSRYKPETYLKVFGEQAYYSKSEIDEGSKNVVIHHAYRFLGMFPWHKHSMHPDTKLFNSYKDISEWKDMEDVECNKNGLAFRVERLLYRLLPDNIYLLIFRNISNMLHKRSDKAIVKKNKYINI